MLYKALQKIEQGMQESEKRPYVVAIDGMSGSGKTTLAKQIQEMISGINVFHMDDFFLQPHQRTPERLEQVGGNVDYERFAEEIILHLTDEQGLRYRAFDCGKQKLREELEMPWAPIVIVEGAYSHHPYFGDVYDLRIFCEISEEEQCQRIRKRNGEVMWNRFVEEWIPKENAYFKKYKIREKSGLVC